ncbi:hypothetical protein BC829DRAFT_441545 [Chytridium lagenaria]|nr:hypothetical protein BC829DRAFT_441545 [Chytridium lagenaria]
MNGDESQRYGIEENSDAVANSSRHLRRESTMDNVPLAILMAQGDNTAGNQQSSVMMDASTSSRLGTNEVMARIHQSGTSPEVPHHVLNFTAGMSERTLGESDHPPPPYDPSRPPPKYGEQWRETDLDDEDDDDDVDETDGAEHDLHAVAAGLEVGSQRREATKRVSFWRLTRTLRTRFRILASILIGIDVFVSLSLLLSTTIVIVNNGASGFSLIIPLVFSILAVLGKGSFSHLKLQIMKSYCFSLLLRWLLDIISIIRRSDRFGARLYWSVEPVRMAIAVGCPGVGMFFSQLFPCSISDGDETSVLRSGSGCVSPKAVYISILMMLVPRMAAIAFLFYYTQYYIQRKERRRAAERRRARQGRDLVHERTCPPQFPAQFPAAFDGAGPILLRTPASSTRAVLTASPSPAS